MLKLGDYSIKQLGTIVRYFKGVKKEKVKIISGPFQNMEGKVESVDLKTQKVNISVDLFGQVTKVEVDMQDIEGLE